VPHYLSGTMNYARWDRFSHAEPLAKFAISGLPNLWWWDSAKSAKTGGRS
jgi:microcin C transport system substrate-binding protein